MPRLTAQRIFLFLPLFFHSAGASYARLPTPPQAQQDLLVLTMPAPQGSRVACWVPHFSTSIQANAVGLPQECLLTTALVTGTNREQEREREGKRKHSYQVGRNEGVTPTERLFSKTTFAASWINTIAPSREAFQVVFVTSQHWVCQKSWNLLMSVISAAPSGCGLWGLVFLRSNSYYLRLNAAAAGRKTRYGQHC